MLLYREENFIVRAASKAYIAAHCVGLTREVYCMTNTATTSYIHYPIFTCDPLFCYPV